MVINIISLVFGVLGSIEVVISLRKRYRVYIKRRGFNTIFGDLKHSGVIIVCPSIAVAGSGPNVRTTYEDSLALAGIQVQFAEHGIQQRVCLHSHLTPGDRMKNLFLICGPKGNSVTSKLLDHTGVDIPYRFTDNSGNCEIRNGSETATHPAFRPGEIDYGIVARVRNPWSAPDHPTTVFLAAGIEGLGTWGASHYMTNMSSELIRRLRAERQDVRRFAAIVESKLVEGYQPSTIVLRVAAM